MGRAKPHAGSVVAAALLLAGCSHGASHPATASATPARGWYAVATVADRDRIRRWRTGFTDALAKLTASDPQAVAAAGPLLMPDAALAPARPQPGAYVCRLVRLPDASHGGGLRTMPPQPCRIEQRAAGLHFAVTAGPQRPGGYLFPDDRGQPRDIFLGTMTLGDESRSPGYGNDAERDLAGTFERIGPARWRIVLPYPKWGSALDLVDIVPAG